MNGNQVMENVRSAHATAGYTLYLVLVILSIVAILFTISLAELRSVRMLAKREVQWSQARFLAESGVVRTEYFLNGGDGRSMDWQTSDYREQVGTYGEIALAVKKFGLFLQCKSTGTRLVTDYTIESLFGRTPPEPLMPALTLTGHVGGLILHKGSSVDGAVVLHHGYVYAKKRGEPIPDYTRRLVHRASLPLPFDTLLLPRLFDTFESDRKSGCAAGGGIRGAAVLTDGNDSLLRSGLLVIHGDCRITSRRCANATIYCEGTCTIESGAKLASIMCYAQKIRCTGGTTVASLLFSSGRLTIEGGHHGSQFCTGDSLVVKNTASFGTGAILAAVRYAVVKDSVSATGGGIFIDQSTDFRGTIICCNAPEIFQKFTSPSITLGKGCSLVANIVTDGDCFMSDCRIDGHVYARAILSNDEKTEYMNYLLSTVITTDNSIPFPLIGELPIEIVRVER